MNREQYLTSESTRFKELTAVLKRRWLTVTIVMILAIAGGIVSTLLSSKVYESVTEITIEGRSPAFNTSNQFDPLNTVTLSNPVDDVPTQMAVLQGYDVLTLALRELGAPIPPPSSELDIDPKVTVHELDTTNVLEIDVMSTDARLAHDMAVQLPTTYSEYVRDQLQARLQQGINFLVTNVSELDSQYKTAEAKLGAFKKQYGITDFGIDATQRSNELASATTELRARQQDLAQAQKTYESMVAARTALAGTLPDNATQSNDAAIQTEKLKIADLESQYQQLLQTYLPNSVKAKQLAAQIQVEKDFLKTMPKTISIATNRVNPQIQAYDQKVDDARANYLSAQAAESAAQSAYESAQASVFKVAGLTDQYNVMKNTVDNDQAQLSATQSKLQDLRLRLSSANNPVTPVGAATNPVQVKPNLVLNLVAAIVAGVLISAGLVILREKGDDRIFSSQAALESSNIKALGAVPASASNKPVLIADGAPVAESYRLLRSALLFTDTGEPFRSICVTSAMNNEGRSEVAANLATSLAQAGHKVVLVDGNLRNASLDKYFGVDNAAGLADVLAGKFTAKEVVRHTKTENLDLLTSGGTSAQSSDLLDGEALPKLIDELKDNYHFVVFDTASCLAGADAQYTAAACDASIFVVKFGVSRRSSTRFCVDLLKRGKANLLGVVFNRKGSDMRGIMDLDLVDVDEVA